MRMAWNALYFGVCLQAASLFISLLLGVSPFLIQSNTDQIETGDIVATWNWGGTGSLVGDVMSGLRFLWDINVPIIESMIIMAKNAGSPQLLTDSFKLVWRFIWNSFAIEFISGRRFMYD